MITMSVQYNFNNDTISCYNHLNEELTFSSFDEMDNYFYQLNSNIRLYTFRLNIFGDKCLNDYLYQNYIQNPGASKLQYLRAGEFRVMITSTAWFELGWKMANHKMISIFDIKNLLNTNNFQSIRDCFTGSFPGASDVKVIADASKYLLDNGISTRTIGRACFDEFKSSCAFKRYFPQLNDNVDKFIRQAYCGGWMYYRYDFNRRFCHSGITYDVNSLYPFVMRNFELPVGEPTYFEREIPAQPHSYYFVHIKCGFHLKERAFPFITSRYMQYRGIEDAKYLNPTGGYLVETFNNDTIELYLPQTLYELFLKYYDVHDLEIIDGYIFFAMRGLFNGYIDKWFSLKCQSVGPKRQLAKLMMNNLYGKFGTDPHQTCYTITTRSHGVGKTANDVQTESIYVPMASAITAIGASITIEASIANYDNFIFAHTDSIHVVGNTVNGIEIDNVELGKWKIEREWRSAYFTTKCNYIEHTFDDEYEIKFFGMPEEVKNFLSCQLKNHRMVYESIIGSSVDYSVYSPITHSMTTATISILER